MRYSASKLLLLPASFCPTNAVMSPSSTQPESTMFRQLVTLNCVSCNRASFLHSILAATSESSCCRYPTDVYTLRRHSVQMVDLSGARYCDAREYGDIRIN